MGRQYGETILEKVLELKAAGHTHREIGEQLGYTKVQIKKLVERYNKRRRKGTPTIPQRRGRPCTRPMTSLKEKEIRIKQLEREVELYRSFLQAAGRM